MQLLRQNEITGASFQDCLPDQVLLSGKASQFPRSVTAFPKEAFIPAEFSVRDQAEAIYFAAVRKVQS